IPFRQKIYTPATSHTSPTPTLAALPLQPKTPLFLIAGITPFLNAANISELVDASDPKRAIFLLDVRDIFGIYDSSITTNRGVIENLQNRTASFGGGRLLEAQCIRPIDDEGFVRGYIQRHGCRLLPVFPALMVVPVVGAILAGILTPLGPWPWRPTWPMCGISLRCQRTCFRTPGTRGASSGITSAGSPPIQRRNPSC
ncbi:MAG TPA: hypothetical protein VIE43_26380, partial [Thermoanaerobaculia bacterium]|nr:hypothetical protein [Thermoanaerobaculia bacterium]